MAAELIYKTTSPDAIAWWREAEKKHAIDVAAREKYETQLTADFGTANGAERRRLWVQGAQVVGVDCAPGETPPASSGWRLDKKSGFWKPNRASKAGMARAVELAALTTVDLRREVPEIGIADLVFAGRQMLTPGVTFDENEEAIYAYWGSTDCRQGAEATQQAAPNIEWTEVPRSVWFARLEALEAKAAA